MQLLGGNQIVFYPSKAGNLEQQLNDCLVQLEEYMDEHQIYPGSFIRHNLFVNIDNQARYRQIKPKLSQLAKRRFPLPMLINVIAQPPAEGDLALESTYIEGNAWNCLFKESKTGSCQLIKKGGNEVVIGAVQVNENTDMQSSAELAFEQIEQLLDQCGMGIGDLVKQWSYLEHMLQNDFSVQRYQVFNDVRTRYYDRDFEGSGYPASTETGMLTGGLIIEFLAVKGRNEKSLTINNPIQKAPHEYSNEVLAGEGAYSKTGPTTPKLERARSLNLDKRSMLFISGTSSIIGERLTAGGDVAEQTVTILETIKKLLERKNLEKAGLKPGAGELKFSLLKIYVANADDFDQVYSVIEPHMGNVPTLMVQATLPRKEILVEIEGEVLIG